MSKASTGLSILAVASLVGAALCAVAPKDDPDPVMDEANQIFSMKLAADAPGGNWATGRIIEGMLSRYVKDHPDVRDKCKKSAVISTQTDLCSWIKARTIVSSKTKPATPKQKQPVNGGKLIKPHR